MRAVFGTRKVHHAIDAGERSAAAPAPVLVKLLLGENVTARLYMSPQKVVRWFSGGLSVLVGERLYP